MFIFAALLAASICGCSDGPTGPATVPVSGTVTLGGQPLDGATVTFQPVTGSSPDAKPAQTVTDEAGKFAASLTLLDGSSKPGLVPAEYSVTVAKMELGPLTSTTTPPKSLVPAKYNNAKTSDLTATVSADQANDLVFALTN